MLDGPHVVISFKENSSTRQIRLEMCDKQSGPQKLDGEVLPSRYEILAGAIRTTIQTEFRVLTALFLSYAHDHLTKIYGPLSFNLSFVHDHSTKIWGSSHRFIQFMCTRPFDRNIWSSFIYSFFCARPFVRQKYMVPFYLRSFNQKLKWLRLDQTIRILTSGDLGVIQLGVTVFVYGVSHIEFKGTLMQI